MVANSTLEVQETTSSIEEPVRVVSAVIDAIPVIGHVKGLVHDICGDHKRAEEAFEAATRTTAVTAAGAGGFLVGGPVTGAALGATAGIGWDATTALATEGKETPGLTGLLTDPSLKTALNAGITVAGDGITGLVGLKLVNQASRRATEMIKANRLKDVIVGECRPSSVAESVSMEAVSSELKNTSRKGVEGSKLQSSE